MMIKRLLPQELRKLANKIVEIEGEEADFYEFHKYKDEDLVKPLTGYITDIGEEETEYDILYLNTTFKAEIDGKTYTVNGSQYMKGQSICDIEYEKSIYLIIEDSKADSLLKKLNRIESDLMDVRSEMKKLIDDKLTPLHIRLKLFLWGDVGEHSSYIVRYDHYDFLGDQNRGEVDICTTLSESLGLDPDYYDLEDHTRLAEYLTNVEKHKDLLEEVFEKNVKSFTIDW